MQVNAAEGGKLRLSVVIPMYNETHRMRESIPDLLAYFARQEYQCEFVIVDDGSTDGTAQLARDLFSGQPHVRVIEERPNRGKGHAVKVGMLAATAPTILFCDADLSTPPSELEKFWAWVDKGYDVVIGSRKMAGANITHHQPAWRENLGKVFTFLTNLIATRNISDVTCGFKCFKREAAQAVFSRSVIDDWSFDAEVLFIAQRRRLKIKEVPVTWHDKAGTKVRLLRDASRSILGLMKIRLNAVRGVYK
ncbi:MAG TPA: dolichyl-phosphate beta-glucosyltransferase [Chloroflexia bacterium]|nr:dolichyl-phosphate beta-glucosyltransferase [Chloroflexia bacterium]